MKAFPDPELDLEMARAKLASGREMHLSHGVEVLETLARPMEARLLKEILRQIEAIPDDLEYDVDMPIKALVNLFAYLGVITAMSELESIKAINKAKTDN